MDNNAILIKLRDYLSIEDAEMREIFKLGGIELTEEETEKMLIDPNDQERFPERTKCEIETLEAFLNGFIIFKRGKKELAPGEVEKPVPAIMNKKNFTNVFLKKLKIALSLSNEDMIDIFESVDVIITKSDLTCIFRKEGHKHYKKCDERRVNAFLRGLANTDM